MSSKQPITFFKELTRIPRDTGDEKAISDYLMAFARENGLKAVQDEAFNVVIYKPGTPGYEQAPTVVLQGHLDMVYIKDAACTHDYNSPLELIEETGTLRARGTSLGADNGIGVAYSLALLDSTGLSHPPLEALFTTGEEVGMTGVEALDPSWIHGRRLLNLDSGEEGSLTAGCAGGLRVSVRVDPEWRPAPAHSIPYRLQIHGLLGGHSGIEIDQGRGNALRLLGRTLHSISQEISVAAGALSGGSKTNAIPDRAEAVLLLEKQDIPALERIVQACQAAFQDELSAADPEVALTLEPVDYSGQSLSPDALNRMIMLLCTIPTGIQSMSMQIPGLVESSNNLGILTCADGSLTISCAIRSSVGSLKYALCAQIELLAKAADAGCEQDNIYPEWPYRADSPLRDVCVAAYKEMYGKEPTVGVIHAGLECGYFKEMWPDMDLISMGPNVSGAHTPEEALDLGSSERLWQYLTRLMAAMKA